MDIFTILIRQESADQFVGIVEELPIMGMLRAARYEEVINRFQKEIVFLIKDRPDLKESRIRVEMQLIPIDLSLENQKVFL